MRCTHCGALIPDDQMVCPECGTEVQIVPDYNPLDDVLSREVKGSVERATRQIQTDDIRRYSRRNDRTENINSTRVLSPEERKRIRDRRRAGDQRQTENMAGRSAGNVRGQRRSAEEARRQKRIEAAKRKRRNLLISLFLLLVFIAAIIYLVYQNSYTSMINKGYQEIQNGDYASAESYFDRAVRKDESRPDAYVGYAEIYIDQDDLESAENVFLSAIKEQTTNEKLYQAAIDFYLDTEQLSKISELLEDCEDQNVLSAVSDYISSAPVFTPEEGTYSEVQEITISSETGGDIYYTIDGTDPTEETGIKYEEPVLIQTEGEVEIRAMAINANGIPSTVSSAAYTIEFPIVNAPAVTPSTGQYTEPTQITITVPDGYTAYYTMDGSTPDPDSSSTSEYTGPVDMPENAQTIFKAILVNDQNGKSTEVTTRNYITTD